MKPKLSCSFGWIAAFVLFLLALFAPAEVRSADSKSPSPAKVEHGVKETELATLTLTPQAEKRLGIVLVPITRKSLPETRLFGGEVMVPLGPKGESRPGAFPLTSSTPEGLLKLADQQALADGEVGKAQVQLDAAQVVLTRTERLVRDDAGSLRAVDDAKAQIQLAESALKTARARRELLGAAVGAAIGGGRLWVRVAVYSGELPLVDTAGVAQVGSVSARPGEKTVAAQWVIAPPSANAATATVDLFYEIEGADAALRPGQRVGVIVPLRGEKDSLVVPWAAILHDIHGNTWVYENTAPQTFVRRRVAVSRLAGNEAVLANGPKAGTKVVTEGAAELFGAEFGGFK